MVEASRCTVVGLALAVGFIVSGHGFSKFNKTVNQCLGIQAISKNHYYEVVKLIYPQIHDILIEMREEEKANMRAVDDGHLAAGNEELSPQMEFGTHEATLAKMARSSSKIT